MCCDSEIDKREIEIFYSIWKDIDKDTSIKEIFEKKINEMIDELHKKGKGFYVENINNLKKAELSKDEKHILIESFIKMMNADSDIVYSEIMYFKKIFKTLNLTKEDILSEFPDIDPILIADDINPPFSFFDELPFIEMKQIEFKHVILDDIITDVQNN